MFFSVEYNLEAEVNLERDSSFTKDKVFFKLLYFEAGAAKFISKFLTNQILFS